MDNQTSDAIWARATRSKAMQPTTPDVDPAQPGSPEHEQLTKGAQQWRHWGATDPQGNLAMAENVARELEILRDTGKTVWLNPRC